MNEERKYVLTIAGFDPSAGAGILADVKTFEKHKVYGLAISTANTIQTENEFISLEWEKTESILKSIDALMNAYDISVVKTGIVPSFEVLEIIVDQLKKKNNTIKIIVDPVISSSTRYNFLSNVNSSTLERVLKKIYLLTPNVFEAQTLSGKSDVKTAAEFLSGFCNVLLKGGHAEQNVGHDLLISKGKVKEFKPSSTDVSPKHGSGCILSAAIVANLALGLELEEACKEAKMYTEKILKSSKGLLAYHV